MLEFYEQQAIKIKWIEPWLSIIGVILFISTIFGIHVQFENEAYAFLYVMIMMWVCGIAFAGHMLAQDLCIVIQ